VILDALTVAMPGDMVRDFMHRGSDIATAAAHVLAALHTDPIERRRAPSVGTVFVLCDNWTWHLVVAANYLDERAALPQT
jgi:hypothetical protein